MEKIFCDNCLMDIPDTELCFVAVDPETGLEVTLCAGCLKMSPFIQNYIKKEFARWQELEQDQQEKEAR